MSILPAEISGQLEIKIGNGNKAVIITYNSVTIGPIFANDDKEVENMFELFKSMVKGQ